MAFDGGIKAGKYFFEKILLNSTHTHTGCVRSPIKNIDDINLHRLGQHFIMYDHQHPFTTLQGQLECSVLQWNGAMPSGWDVRCTFSMTKPLTGVKGPMLTKRQQLPERETTTYMLVEEEPPTCTKHPRKLNAQNSAAEAEHYELFGWIRYSFPLNRKGKLALTETQKLCVQCKSQMNATQVTLCHKLNYQATISAIATNMSAWSPMLSLTLCKHPFHTVRHFCKGVEVASSYFTTCFVYAMLYYLHFMNLPTKLLKVEGSKNIHLI